MAGLPSLVIILALRAHEQKVWLYPAPLTKKEHKKAKAWRNVTKIKTDRYKSFYFIKLVNLFIQELETVATEALNTDEEEKAR